MGFLSKARDRAKQYYKRVDTRLGGRLPGGVPVTKKQTPAPVQSKKSSFVGPVKPSTPKKTFTPSKPSNFSSNSSSRVFTPKKTFTPSKPSSSSSGTIKAERTQKGLSQDKPQSIVTAYQRPKGGAVSEKLRLGSIGGRVASRLDILRTQKVRSRTGNIKPLKEAELIALGFARGVVGGVSGLVDLPETAFNIARNPKALAQLPGLIKQSGSDFGSVLRTSPGEALASIGGEIVTMKAGTSVLNKLGKLSKAQLTKLNPKYVGKAKVGETLKINVGKGKTVDLEVVGKIPKETLKSQVSKAGKKVKVAISSQADSLLGVIRSRSKTIRKPIPGEETFNTATKNLLKQFDKGTINKKNLIKLDSAIKKQGAKGLLERSFFADPTGKVRPSRLGVVEDKTGSLLDYFVEDIVLKKSKPQILLFEDISVQSLPKSLKTVGKKLKKGIALTKKEADSLLKFQLKKSNKFKPVGFTSGESELTLAPGEILKRVKKVGVTIANGKRIPIVKTEVFKPTGKIKSLIGKFEKGTLTKAQTKALDKLLKKETGFNYGLSSSKKIAGKYVSVKKVSAGILSKLSPKKTSPSRIKVTTKKITGLNSKSPGVKPKPITKQKITSKPKVKVKRRRGKSSLSKSKPKVTSKPKVKPKITSKPKSIVKRKVARTYGKFGGYSKITSKSPIGPRSPRPSISTKSPSSRKSPISPRSPRSPKYTRSPRGPAKTGKRILPGRKKKKVPKKKVRAEGYNVYEKRGPDGKFKKVTALPLKKKDAKDRLAYRLDNKISRTAKLVPIRKVKKLGKLPATQKGYFKKAKKNFRNYKIVKGKRVPTPNTFIEKKGRGVINTPGEKRQLALNRKLKSRKTPKKTPKISRPKKKSTRQTPSRSKKKR